MSSLTRRLAGWLRTLADRIDHEGAPKLTHRSFTFTAARIWLWRLGGKLDDGFKAKRERQ